MSSWSSFFDLRNVMDSFASIPSDLPFDPREFQELLVWHVPGPSLRTKQCSEYMFAYDLGSAST